MENLKNSAIYQNQFSELKNEIINYLSLSINQNDFFIQFDNLKECKNINDLKNEIQYFLWTNLYQSEIIDRLINDFLEIELIDTFESEKMKIAKFVFYTDKYDLKEISDNISEWTIIQSIRKFKEFNEEF